MRIWQMVLGFLACERDFSHAFRFGVDICVMLITISLTFGVRSDTARASARTTCLL
ncbi:hypothetical protein FHS20_003650 [Phyllobacterium endophyticum]|nr:hypothetical protein [Phyllobacterium endophyticum]